MWACSLSYTHIHTLPSNRLFYLDLDTREKYFHIWKAGGKEIIIDQVISVKLPNLNLPFTFSKALFYMAAWTHTFNKFEDILANYHLRNLTQKFTNQPLAESKGTLH